jgi:hypothetical protein
MADILAVAWGETLMALRAKGILHRSEARGLLRLVPWLLAAFFAGFLRRIDDLSLTVVIRFGRDRPIRVSAGGKHWLVDTIVLVVVVAYTAWIALPRITA